MGNTPRVALLVETARGFGRNLLRGIARYAHQNGHWNFYINPGDFEHALPAMKRWGGTGIIARIPNEHIAQAILDANLPTIAIGLSDEQKKAANPLSKFSNISSDAKDVARLVSDHLLERRFSHFAFVGLKDRDWSHRREAAFRARIRQAGSKVFVFEEPPGTWDHRWEAERESMVKWLRELPTPVGIFACNDERGRQVLEACRNAELDVPGDAAVVGVDNDEVFCDLADPPLSSVALNSETAGYRAAELLDHMMQGRVSKPRHVLVESLGVVARRSTDVIAIDDEDVSSALQFIRNVQGYGVSVDAISEAVAVPRRRLERRFREVIGRTILQEIQMARIERSKQLLLETTYPISKVARLAGFGSTGYFVQLFHDRVGHTPRKFRLAMTT